MESSRGPRCERLSRPSMWLPKCTRLDAPTGIYTAQMSAGPGLGYSVCTHGVRTVSNMEMVCGMCGSGTGRCKDIHSGRVFSIALHFDVPILESSTYLGRRGNSYAPGLYRHVLAAAPHANSVVVHLHAKAKQAQISRTSSFLRPV